MKKVSVIMPIYNVDKYLDRSIDSLLRQTLEDIEIILIDDGSTDHSKEIIKKYQQLYPDKINARFIKNSGAAHARNIGLELAQGEYIGFVDSDDYVDRTMFEKLYQLAKSDQADITTCGYYRIDYKDIQRRDIAAHKCFGKNVFQAPDLLINNVPYIWNKLFKRSLIESTGIKFEENLHIFEDLVFTFKLFLKANRISRVNEALYSYIFSRSDSLTFTFSSKRFDLFAAFDSLIRYYKENNCFYHFDEELLFILMNHIYVVCGSEVSLSNLPLKYKFINQGFEYMEKNFPYWKDYVVYYRKYKKNKFLYSKKMYWRLYSLLPRNLRILKKHFNAFVHNLNFNRAGSYYYRAYKNTNLKEKRILVNSQHGVTLNGNMFYILKELCSNEDYYNYEIGITYKNDRALSHFKKLIEEYGFVNRKLVYLKNNSKEYAGFLATSKYLFNDTSFPVYFIKKEGQVYLNTWHGTPLKTLGRSTANDYYDIANLQKNFVAADYLLYPSPYMTRWMLRDYMLRGIAENKILQCGYPRNEIFFDQERGALLREQYGFKNKQVIAYMPTWRGNLRSVDAGQKDELQYMLDEIDCKLNDDQVMVVNLHPYVSNSINYNVYRHIYKFPDHLETYDFLNCSDILVTDYSSVFFDYAVSKKKIILFAYDEEEYFHDRGVYMNFAELPFVKVNTVDDLIAEINTNENNVDYSAFIDTYCHYDKNDVSKQICEQVIQNKKTSLHIDQLQISQKKLLVFANDFRDVHIVDQLKDLFANVNMNNGLIYLTYVTKEIRDRLFLKELPRKINYMGVLNAFSCNPPIDCILLSLIENHPIIYRIFKHRIHKAILREWERAYHNINFDTCVVFGYESVKNILMAVLSKGKKVLYITDANDFNDRVPKSVYEKFDYVIYKNETVKRQCLYQGNNVLVKELLSFDEFFK